MKKHYLKTVFLLTFLVSTVLLSACGNQRFGETVKLDEKGNLPPLEYPKVTDEEAGRAYLKIELLPSLAEREVTKKKREEMQKNLLKPWPREKEQRIRIGRLWKSIEKDQSQQRHLIVQLWAIKYGQKLHGEEAKRAEKVLYEKVFPECDFDNFFYYVILQAMVEDDKVEYKEQDTFFRTGEFPEAPPTTPK